MKNELYAANQQQAFGIAVLLLVLVISPVIIFLVRNATVTIQVTFSYYFCRYVCFTFYSSSGVFNIAVKKSSRAETREKKSRCPDLSDVASFCSKGFIKIPSEGKISC